MHVSLFGCLILQGGVHVRSFRSFISHFPSQYCFLFTLMINYGKRVKFVVIQSNQHQNHLTEKGINEHDTKGINSTPELHRVVE